MRQALGGMAPEQVCHAGPLEELQMLQGPDVLAGGGVSGGQPRRARSIQAVAALACAASNSVALGCCKERVNADCIGALRSS